MLSTLRIQEELTEQLKDNILDLQKIHKEKVEGIEELFNQLYVSGVCRSVAAERIYYIAYTLATKRIEFTIE